YSTACARRQSRWVAAVSTRSGFRQARVLLGILRVLVSAGTRAVHRRRSHLRTRVTRTAKATTLSARLVPILALVVVAVSIRQLSDRSQPPSVVLVTIDTLQPDR